MTPEKLWELCERYDRDLAAAGFEATEMSPAEYAADFASCGARLPAGVLLPHCRWMMRRCLDVFREHHDVGVRNGYPELTRDNFEKAMRWVCYVQGVTNAVGFYSCSRLREHSRGAKPETGDERYARLEKEHLGDPDKGTGVYAPAEAVGPATAPALSQLPPREARTSYGASSDADWDAE